MDAVPPLGQLRTERLVLRRWRHEDLEPFAALNADPRVMEHFPAPLDRAESDAMVERIEAHFEAHGWGLWAAEVVASGAFTGFIGLWPPGFEAHFTPAVEVGRPLAHEHWGQGCAPEGARAAITDGFERLGLEEIVSMTSVGNDRSRRVIEKLGMTHDPDDDFDHPRMPPGHRLERHVLYRLRRDGWAAAAVPRSH